MIGLFRVTVKEAGAFWTGGGYLLGDGELLHLADAADEQKLIDGLPGPDGVRIR